jgi:hypothetical protein
MGVSSNLISTCHSERSEESISISAPLESFVSPAGFFASLRMTNGFEDTS